MRAVLCRAWGGPETLTVEEVATPEPGPGEVRIRMLAAGVNFPDVLIIQKKYQVQPPLPFTPGAEIAGEVEAVGPGTTLRPGTRVAAFCSLGGFAEQVVVAESACIVLPDAVDTEQAASLLLAYGTSWHALRDRALLRAGETLLVLGAGGGVGLAAVDIGHAMGARVVAAASSAEKLAAAREHGAVETIDTGAGALREDIARTCGKAGPDVIYDPVGGDLTEPAFRSIAWGGRHLVVGFAAGATPSIPLNLPLLKGASLVGVFWGGFARHQPDEQRAETEEMMSWLAAGRLRPKVSRRYRLADVAAALTDMAERRVIGKVVIVP
jgi:NADPH2:quinone reductase